MTCDASVETQMFRFQIVPQEIVIKDDICKIDFFYQINLPKDFSSDNWMQQL